MGALFILHGRDTTLHVIYTGGNRGVTCMENEDGGQR